MPDTAPTFNSLALRLKAGGTVFGYSVTTSSRHVVRTIATSGSDFVIIDTEHAPIGPDGVHDLIASTAGTGCLPLVRVAAPADPYSKPALDSGAVGILVPRVETAAEAQACVDVARYPPMGLRGFGPAFALDRWNLGLDDYLAVAAGVLVIVLIESVRGHDNLAEILAIGGIDVVLIATGDLASSLGHVGHAEHPDVLRAVERIERDVLTAGLILGGSASDPAAAADLQARGYRFICLGRDLGELSLRIRTTLARIRELL